MNKASEENLGEQSNKINKEGSSAYKRLLTNKQSMNYNK